MKRAGLLLVSLLVVLVSLGGCSKSISTSSSTGTSSVGSSTPTTTTTAAERRPQGTLTVALETLGNEQWLPHLGDSISNMYTLSNDLLIEKKPGTDELVPSLAESWEYSPDGQTWTFHLNKGVKFQDNWGEFTSADVKFTYDLIVGKDSINSLKSSLGSLVQSIDTPDAYTVIFHTKPTWQLGYLVASNLSYFRIVSKKYVESVGIDSASKNPIGTSPWKFIEQKSGDYVKYQAVDNWRQVPYYQTVILRKVPEESTRVAMLKTGQADLASISVNSIADVKKAGLKIHESPNNINFIVYYAGLFSPTRDTFNPNLPWVGPDPAKALKVRQALALAVDQKSILANVLGGLANPMAVPLFFPGMPATDPNLKPYPYDPARAKALLAEAGYPNGFNMDLGYFIATAPENQMLTEAVAQYWEAIGIHTRVLPIDFTTLKPVASARKNYTTVLNSISRPAEPVITAQVVWGSNASILYGPEDPSGKLEGLMKAAIGEMDIGKRTQIQRDLAQYFYDNYWAVPIASGSSFFASNNKIAKWPRPSTSYAMDLEGASP